MGREQEQKREWEAGMGICPKIYVRVLYNPWFNNDISQTV